MFLLALIPGLPKFSFFAIAGFGGVSARAVPERQSRAESAEKAEGKPLRAADRGLLKLDELSLEVGYALVPWSTKQGGQLLRVCALCAAIWQCSWDSSFHPFTLPTI